MSTIHKLFLLDDLVSFTPGYPFKSSELEKKGTYPIIKIKELKHNKILLTEATDWFDASIEGKLEKHILRKNDIVMALTGDFVDKSNPDTWVGRTSIYNNDIVALLNQRLVKIEPKNDHLLKMFLYYWLINFT